MHLFAVFPLALSIGIGVSAVGAVSLDADADTNIEGKNFANSVLGDGPSLAASYQVSETRSFKTYLRFDLGAYPGEKSNAVLSLTESFHYPHNFSHVPYRVYGMHDSAGDDWIESGMDGISFNTAPANNPDDYFDMSEATFLANWSVPIAPPAGTLHSFDDPALTSFLNDGLGNDGLATLIILNEQCCYEPFASREQATDPEIFDGPRYDGPRLSFDVMDAEPPVSEVPLPAALPLSLAALGALGWISRRHRHG